MANPRQRRKTRSSSYKPVHHSRQAKKLLKKQPVIRGPKALQEAWDRRKTVRQNYAALGLATSLNPRVAGGVERVTADTEDNGDIIEVDMTSSEPSLSTHKADANSGSLPKGHGRIVRDEQGNVVEVEMEDEVDDEAPEEEPLIEERASGVTPETKDWVTMPARKQATEVVQALEKASSLAKPVRRFSSTGEGQYLQRLVEKYGDDVEKMARDRKLNVEQRTAGQLSRAIRKAGGIGRLQKTPR